LRIKVSQGNVVMQLRCSGIFNQYCKLPLSPLVKELWKSVNIWQCYRQQ